MCGDSKSAHVCTYLETQQISYSAYHLDLVGYFPSLCINQSLSLSERSGINFYSYQMVVLVHVSIALAANIACRTCTLIVFQEQPPSHTIQHHEFLFSISISYHPRLLRFYIKNTLLCRTIQVAFHFYRQNVKSQVLFFSTNLRRVLTIARLSLNDS